MAALPVYRREMPVLGLISQRISAGRSRVSSPARPCRLSANGGSLGRREKRLLVPVKALKLCNCDYSINSRGVCQQKNWDFENLFLHGRFQGVKGWEKRRKKRAPRPTGRARGLEGWGFCGFNTADRPIPKTILHCFVGRAECALRGRRRSPRKRKRPRRKRIRAGPLLWKEKKMRRT